MKDNKKNLKIVFIILVALALLVSASYALLTFVLRGTKESNISLAKVSLSYTESESGISIKNPTAMNDSEGIVSGTSTTFSVSASSSKAQEVPYYIYLSLDSGNTIDNSKVRLYLEDITNSATYGPVTISTLKV